MAEKLPMLALSPTMEVGTIAAWNVTEGADVSSGDVLCEVQTDKTTMEYESMADGVLLKILVPEGGQAQVGEPIAIVGEQGEDIEALLKEATAEKPAAAPAEAPAAAPAPRADEPAPSAPAVSPAPAAAAAGKIKSSPLARKIAQREGIDLTALRGSGPAGRIVKRDVEAALAQPAPGTTRPRVAPSATLEDRVAPVTEKRRIIAQRLAESKFTAPHYYLKVRVAMDNLMASRKALNARQKENVSVNAFLIKFAAEALKRHPQVNASWNGDTITFHGSIDIGLAVAQPDGLIAPIVRNAGGKGILAIEEELRLLIDKAQKGTLTPEEYVGATFTITNLGSFGIEEFTAIINPPGSAILAVGAMQRTQVFGPDDQPALASLAALTLSCDHRVIDGAIGAAFMSDLKGIIQDPIKALY